MYTKPFTDDKLRWDEYEERYFITEDALKLAGVDLRARFTSAGKNADSVVKSMIRLASSIFYGYLHDGSLSTEIQDHFVHHTLDCRVGIYRSLLEIAISLARYGNRFDSVEEAERIVAIPMLVRQECEVDYDFLNCGTHAMKYSGRWI